MAWPTVAPSDVANLWRPLTSEEESVATARIKVVEAELRRELRLHGVTGTPVVGDPSYETPEEVAEWVELYTATVADVVAGSLKNPDGWSEERERIDDYERTRRRDDDAPSGVAYIDEADILRLLPVRRRKRGAFTIHLGQS